MGKVRREYPEVPMVGVGALVVKGDEILLVKRAHEPGKGLWSIPGGLVRLGEKLVDAIKREVKEETNVDIDIVKLLDVCEVMVADEAGRIKFHYVLVDYLARYRGGEARPSSDVLDVKWAKPDQALKLSLTKSARKLLGKLIAEAKIQFQPSL